MQRVELESRVNYYRDLRGVAVREAQMRVFLAGALVLGTIAAVLLGVILQLDPQKLSLLLTPVSGLAGIAVGYFFGRGASTPGGDLAGDSGSSNLQASPDEQAD